MEDSNIEISFELSVCLHLDKEAVFLLKINERDVEIKTNDVIYENTRFGRAQNTEIYSDTDSGFRYTKITISFKDTNPKIPLDNLILAYKDLILESVNKFIDAYRFITGRVAISNIASISDLFGLSCFRRNAKGGGTGMITINFGGVGIAGKQVAMGQFKTDLDIKDNEKMQNLLKTGGIPLEDLFIMDAKRHLQIGHKIQALISAVIATEIVVRSKNNWFVRFLYKGKLLEFNLIKELKYKLPKESLSIIIGGIKERNRVIHDGKRDLTIDISKYIKETEKAINKLRTPVII
ncbi:MAG: hypothetical protein HYX20_01145 [Candidatus Yanofskybacteria bacterium]|nr:hypothetical protein [Candidatus Yanofskybacteria bacterium]